MHQHWFRGIVALAVIASVASVTRAADLDAAQKKLLNEAAFVMKSVETSLKQASDSAGADDAPLTGSRAKLTASRLSNPIAQIPQAKERLAKLPADHPDVKAMQARVDAADATVGKLKARLAGASAPQQPAEAGKPAGDAPAGGAAPAAPAEARLDYRSQQTLKDAQYHLSNAEGSAAALAEFAAKAKGADASTLNYVEVNTAVQQIEMARGKAKLAGDRIPTLPPNGAGVAKLSADHKAVLASLDASAAILTPIHATLSKTVDPGAYPAFANDLKRVQGFSHSYNRPELLSDRPTDAIDLVTQYPAAKEEVARIAKLYAPIIQQQTDQGKQIGSAIAFFNEQSTKFDAALKSTQSGLPADINGYLTKATEMGDDAVKNNKPLFFAGGIQDQLKYAEMKIALQEAIDPEAAADSKTKLADTRAKLKQQQASFREAIIAANELPPDRYAGADKAALAQAAIGAWGKVQPGAEVLSFRIPSQDWERQTLWRYENREWTLIDRSKLQVQLLVKHDDKLAVVRPVNLFKNHVSNDTINYVPMDLLADELQADRYIPLAKVK